MTRLAFVLPVAAFAALLVWFAAGLERDPGYLPSMLIDRPAPDFDLPPIAGRERGFSTEDLKGRVSMVNIFGSWCATCAIEHPVLMEMAREGVAPIYGLNWKD
ncbi:MAG: redoxin family protein [Parvularculaceae bacterium]